MIFALTQKCEKLNKEQNTCNEIILMVSTYGKMFLRKFNLFLLENAGSINE